MKLNLVGAVVGVIAAIVLSGLTLRADSVVMINVSGATTGSQSFTSAMNQPISSGPFTLGTGVTFANVSLVGNQPGSVSEAFVTNTHTAVTNNSAGMVNIAVGFAANDFSLPAQSPLTFNASQTVNVVSFGTGNSVSEQFIGFADAANSLTPGMGTADVTPVCVVIAGSPTNSCATSGSARDFNHSGNFALNGVEMFSLVPGQTADFTGSINATPVATAAEPVSMLTLAFGILLLPWARKRGVI